jgi:hypothetical protein
MFMVSPVVFRDFLSDRWSGKVFPGLQRLFFSILMKLRNLIVLAPACFFLVACGGLESQPWDTGGRLSEPVERTPEIGMSSTQLIAMYGDPDTIDRSPCCETWFYSFKDRRVFIPDNVRSRARNGVFIFGKNGKLKDFGYNQ